MFIDLKSLEEVSRNISSREEKEAFYELASLVHVESNNIDELKELFKIYVRSKYSQKLALDLELNGNTKYLGKIMSWKVNGGNIVASLGNGIKVRIPLNIFEGATADEIYDTLQKLIYLELVKVKKKITRKGRTFSKEVIIVSRMVAYDTVADVDTAKKLLEEKHPILTMVEALGFKPRYQTIRAVLPRLISLFKIPIEPYYTSAIHLLQFTIPATGKTTTAFKLSNILNLEVVIGLPSPAKLIYNASTQEFGLVFLRDFVVMDEFDKGFTDKQNAYQFFSIVEGGMATGRWVREKYTKKAISEMRKDTTLIFYGNLEGKLLKEIEDTRDYLRKFLESKFESEAVPSAFIDRLAIVDIYDELPLVKFTHNKIVPSPILRGLFEVLTQRALEVKSQDFGLSGRRELQARQVYKVLVALNVDQQFAYEMTKAIVLGTLDRDRYYRELYKQITGKEPEPPIEEENVEAVEL